MPALNPPSLSLPPTVASLWYQRKSAAYLLEQHHYLQQLQQQQQHMAAAAAATSSASASSPGRPVCPFCRKELKNVHSLNVHISRYHSETNDNNVEVICPVCERKYGNKYSLRTHMHLNHKDQLHLLGTAKKSGAGKKDEERNVDDEMKVETAAATEEVKDEVQIIEGE